MSHFLPDNYALTCHAQLLTQYVHHHYCASLTIPRRHTSRHSQLCYPISSWFAVRQCRYSIHRLCNRPHYCCVTSIITTALVRTFQDGILFVLLNFATRFHPTLSFDDAATWHTVFAINLWQRHYSMPFEFVPLQLTFNDATTLRYPISSGSVIDLCQQRHQYSISDVKNNLLPAWEESSARQGQTQHLQRIEEDPWKPSFSLSNKTLQWQGRQRHLPSSTMDKGTDW